MTQTVKFKKVAKDRLFYDLWQYCVAFYLPEVTALKKVEHEYIDHVIERRRHWRIMTRQRWANIMSTTPTFPINDISYESQDNLHKFADVLLDLEKPYKLVTSINHGWFYTNDLQAVHSLVNCDLITQKQYSQAYVNRSKNTIKLKNSKHTHRTYLKSGRIDEQEKKNIKTFIDNQKEYIRVGPAFSKWLNNPFYFVHDNFFIDHNGEGWLVMLSLVKSGIVRKTISIVPA